MPLGPPVVPHPDWARVMLVLVVRIETSANPTRTKFFSLVFTDSLSFSILWTKSPNVPGRLGGNQVGLTGRFRTRLVVTAFAGMTEVMIATKSPRKENQ